MKGRLGRVLVGILGLVLPLGVFNRYVLYLVSLALVYYMAAAGTDLLVGYTDQLSLAGAAFFGLGAYTVALGSGLLHQSWAEGVLAAAAVGAMGGMVLGLPALRVQHLSLGVSTLAGVVVLNTWFNASPSFLGGSLGGSQGLVVPAPTIGGHPLSSRWLWAGIYGSAAAVWAVERNLIRSQYGRILWALKDSPLALESLGTALAPVKMGVFVFSSALIAVAGAWYGLLSGTIDPTVFDPNLSITLIAMAVIGGSGWEMGPLVGALFVTVLPQVFALMGFGPWANLSYAIAFFLTLRWAPEGLGRRWSRAWQTWRAARIRLGRRDVGGRPLGGG
ncbi:MAG: branched-chain amino acid ABC transporter permease [Firmicutes bacterium]|nr:branched-chain amino acid ABC transporter permease [Alicyclobacillaceae bacterium]MCL6496758.1 branched-chain amino acid ABC transporter permease [Bacillota bacterium]